MVDGPCDKLGIFGLKDKRTRRCFDVAACDAAASKQVAAKTQKFAIVLRSVILFSSSPFLLGLLGNQRKKTRPCSSIQLLFPRCVITHVIRAKASLHLSYFPNPPPFPLPGAVDPRGACCPQPHIDETGAPTTVPT